MDPIVLNVMHRYICGRPMKLGLQVPGVNQTPGLCGPACLKSVLGFFGVDVELSELAKASGATAEDGVGAEGILKAARQYGFDGYVKEGTSLDEVRSLIEQGTPVIVNWWKRDDGHYSVVSDINGTEVQLMDPETGGPLWLVHEEFEQLWFDFPINDIERKQPCSHCMIVITPRVVVSSDVTAIIRKEKGEYCVRSPNNPDWNGGCYPSKDKAEERLRQVEYFKHKSAAHRVTLRFALAKGIAFDKLKSMSQAELKKLGLGVWDEPKGGVATMLFPAEWYKEIPAGFDIVDIFGEKEKFQPGKSDDDQRMGFLPYGIEVKVARRFIEGLRARS